jgi:hypothetical protein
MAYLVFFFSINIILGMTLGTNYKHPYDNMSAFVKETNHSNFPF